MQCSRPAHRPGIIVADVGDLMGQDAGDLIARHAAQQPLGQYNRSVSRTTQRVGIHIARSWEAIDIRQSRQVGSAANVDQYIEQFRQIDRTQQVRAEPSKHGLARDRRTVRSRRASSQRPVNSLGSTNDPTAYREQHRHRGDRQCG